MQMKKTKNDAEAVFDLKIQHDHCEGRTNERKPAEKGITIGKTGNGKADHDCREENKKFFSDRNLSLANIARSGLISLIWIHQC